MSRLGKKPISIPEKIEVSVNDVGLVVVKGPKGELNKKFDMAIVTAEVKDRTVVLEPQRKDKQAMASWGTYASHLKNMMSGVSEGFTKKLAIEGVGFKAQVEGGNLVLNLGLSHPVKVEIPASLKVVTEKNVIVVSGADKEQVGQFSASVRALKKPEPYKGTGIRYEGEFIRRKAGKKAATAA